MTSIFPSRATIDYWERLGNKGWTFDKLKPYYRKYTNKHDANETVKAMNRMPDVSSSAGYTNGPIHLSYGAEVSEMNSAWVDTHAKFGISTNGNDPLDGNDTGTFYSTTSVDPHAQTRSYAAPGYYGPKVRQRGNLTVLTETRVEKIFLEGQEPNVVATGAQLRKKDGSQIQVRAKHEVILAAGAIQSPQILELSGIGGRKLLESHNVPVFVDNPGVGENLQDHNQTAISYEIRDGLPSMDQFRDPKLVQAAMQQYETTKEGPLAGQSHSVSYLPIMEASGPMAPEEKHELLQRHLDQSKVQEKLLGEMLGQPNEPALALLCFPCQEVVGPDVPAHFGMYITPQHPQNYVSLLHSLGHPFSRGSCHIQSADINTQPAIDPGYLTHPLDIEITARSIMFGEKLVSTEPFASTVLKPNGARLQDLEPGSLKSAMEVARKRTISFMHPSCSCPMMPRSEGGVVDDRLFVYGTRNLRIVDASVFPLIPLGNIQPTVYAVAERAADFIKDTAAQK